MASRASSDTGGDPNSCLTASSSPPHHHGFLHYSYMTAAITTLLTPDVGGISPTKHFLPHQLDVPQFHFILTLSTWRQD